MKNKLFVILILLFIIISSINADKSIWNWEDSQLNGKIKEWIKLIYVVKKSNLLTVLIAKNSFVIN